MISRMYYSLHDAAERLKQEEIYLLHQGVLGKINFMVPIPQNVRVISWNTPNNEKDGKVRFIEEHPLMFLGLEIDHCCRIEQNNEIEEKEFYFGYSFSEENDELECGIQLTKCESAGFDDYKNRWITIACQAESTSTDKFDLFMSDEISAISTPEDYLPKGMTKIKINRLNLYIPADSFDTLKNELETEQAQTLVQSSADTKQHAFDFALNPDNFQNLNTLFEAAEKFYSNSNTPSPPNEAVQEYLIERGFSKNIAGAGATIIRPVDAPKGRPRKNI